MTDNLNISAGLVTTGFPLALRGYDAVSFFGSGPVRGSAGHVRAHGGATYYFASEANAAAFEAAPDKYLPSFGGFCAYGVSVGKKFDGDPLVWKIVGGRLHLNLNADIHQAFLADLDGAITKADTAWATIAGAPAASL